MRNRLVQSGFYSFLVSLYGTSIYYTIGVLVTLGQGGDVVEFFLNTLLAGVVVFLALWFVFYELIGSLERLNKRDPKGPSADKKNDKSKHH